MANHDVERKTKEYLMTINDKEASDNISDIVKCFVEDVKPLRIILFGSFTSGKNTENSDFDFYLVVDDDRNIADVSAQAYKSIRYTRKRPVDIVVGTKSRFEKYGTSKDSLYIEGEVARTGKVLYEMETVV